MKKLSDKARMYARSYGQPPYGREIEGTAELLLRMAEKLDEYETLEEQKKLLKLPINPETPIYSIEYCCGENKDNKMGMCFRGLCSDCKKKSHYILETTAESSCKISEIGKTVFLTKEEAEAALKELERG